MQPAQQNTLAPNLCKKVSRCHDGAADVMGRIRHHLESSGKKAHYDGLIAVLQEYRQGFATAEDVVSYVSKVLGPYPMLAAEFSEFLPEGVTLFTRAYPALSHPTSRRESVQSSALRFIARIRATDPTLRDPFVVALEQWKRGEYELVEMYETVKILFEGRPDLLEAFHSFLSPADREALLGSSDDSEEDEDDVPSLMSSSSSSVSNSPSSRHGTPEDSSSSPFATFHSSPKIGLPDFFARDDESEPAETLKHTRVLSSPSFPPSKRRHLLDDGYANM